MLRPFLILAGVIFGTTAHQGGHYHDSVNTIPRAVAGQSLAGTGPVRPFRLDQVSLESSLFTEKRDRIKSFIKNYDERRFLVLFNNQAGRPNPADVTTPGGWEDGGLLSGHWTGHYMTALAQSYAEHKEESYKQKLDWMVSELAACQEAITARMSSPSPDPALWTPTHPGYLGALPEDTALRLGPPRWAVYGGNLSTNTWAPWYTQHKIMRGLLDAYYHTGNTQALSVVTRMADWAHLALTLGDMNHPLYSGNNITRAELDRMWDLYIAGEFGGANEVFPEIYKLTGGNDTKHLETAKFFDNRASLFPAAVQDRDILVVGPAELAAINAGGKGRRRERLHANTHVPQFVGYLRVYEYTGESEYLAAAKNFYHWIVPHRLFASGGTGGTYPGASDGTNPELFQNRGNIARAIAENGAETCTTYNVLKLARGLFLLENGAEGYMDTYERGLFNMILGSRADQDSTNNDDDGPLLTYFQPLTPGSRREYGNTGTCCGGTGMESHTKYQETIYFQSDAAGGGASATLWVNLYIASTLQWEERGVVVKQDTAFPRDDLVTFTISRPDSASTDDISLAIKLRIPAWIRPGTLSLLINGEQQQELEQTAKPGSYLTLPKSTWRPNDTIQLKLPMTIRVERASDRPDTQALMYGPVLLQTVGSPPPASSNDTADNGPPFWELSLYQYLKLDGDYSRAAIVALNTTSTATTRRRANGGNDDDPLFTTTTTSGQALPVRPYYISIPGDPVSSYFRRVEPTILFGTVQTHITNRKRDDGLPAYNVPVQGVPAPGHDGLTFLDVVWDQAPFADHARFVSTVDKVMSDFVALGVYDDAEAQVVVDKAKEAERDLDPAGDW
ncbi:uncharacterized protein B0I36DRAFT_234595 [Microdochium trichocladiopsis]|uniref:DUF1680-domain-containing protein n=1 Tax=Microdochium trichocladiopsis TaxID=1682393 RepID=A0A9P9BUZ4_9PEZI|nr:uncharacterized protein B0I36DRAFT_234595 [Microdochium trichocladiopsis]KAH7039763.1 hypothetical protein B0I36DRAFT_234595 [Microdochium trichocladiopsis]